MARQQPYYPAQQPPRSGFIEGVKGYCRRNPSIATYLTYLAAPFALLKLDMPEYAAMFPWRSAAAAFVAHGMEAGDLFPTAARIALGAIGLYNGIEAVGDFKNMELMQGGLEGWLAYTTFRDALIRHRHVEVGE